MRSPKQGNVKIIRSTAARERVVVIYKRKTHSNLKGVNMDSAPRELSLAEIRSFMLRNNCKVTNHALVKHFRAFLTNKETQGKCDSS